MSQAISRCGRLDGGGAVLALDALDALAAAALRAEGVDRLSLDVAVSGEGHDRGLVRDEVGLAELLDRLGDHAGLALLAVGLDQFVHVLGDQGVDLLRVGEQAFEVLDRLGQLLVLLFELGPFKLGKAPELHLEHGLGLALGEIEGVILQSGRGRLRPIPPRGWRR